jgi:hypothetical protein
MFDLVLPHLNGISSVSYGRCLGYGVTGMGGETGRMQRLKLDEMKVSESYMLFL